MGMSKNLMTSWPTTTSSWSPDKKNEGKFNLRCGIFRYYPSCFPPPNSRCNKQAYLDCINSYSACRGIMFMSSYRLFNRINLCSTNFRCRTRAKHISHSCLKVIVSEQSRSFAKRQNHTSITANMSLLQHTGPSTLYTELAELPLPVSADFVGGDGASFNTIRYR
jgi:hypothetical protein